MQMKNNFFTRLYYRDYVATLLRLTKMIRGIGNPLVAVYARCYLCRIGISVMTTDTKYIIENIYDFIDGYKNVSVPNN